MPARRLRRHRVGVLLPVVVAMLLVVTGCSSGDDHQHARETPLGVPSATTSSTARPASGRPDIVFVLTDDLSSDLLPYMPHVQAMLRSGTSFRDYTVTDSLCCPSRASIFTGRFPHDTGVYKNTGPDGGFAEFHKRGLEQKTFATALHAAGYRTAMMGKYLNGYRPRGHLDGQRDYVPPGWDEWDVAGDGYPEYGYRLNHDGSTRTFGRRSRDYLTDVLSGAGTRFVSDSAQRDQPFFLEVATFAPHVPSTPAPRDRGTFAGLRAPRGPAFDRQPTDAPGWLRVRPPLSPSRLSLIDAGFRKRVEAVQAVDQMIGRLQATLEKTGRARNTVFVFSSDNGYHMGQYRLEPGKQTAFDTDVVVPLVVTGPRIARGAVLDEPAQNVDLAPTFETLAGVHPPADVDGRSLTGLLHGRAEPQWRKAALVEHHGPLTDPDDPDLPALDSGNPPSYRAMRTLRYTYVEYRTGERELYDRVRDPYELHNVYRSQPAARRALLHRQIVALSTCHGSASCSRAGRLLPAA